MVPEFRNFSTADQLLIGNNGGGINGWVPRTDVLGKVVAVAD